MSNEQAIAYITRRDWRESRLGLTRMKELLAHLGNPQQKLKFVHVAGTNGKGSTCCMLSSILREAGYRTGLYISPYITRFNERVQVNGVSISDEDLNAVTEQVGRFADQMEDHPTEFEMITVIGLQYFAQQGCDIVVLEVGMGGSLDATNIIDFPEVAVIAPVSLDHTEFLGDTVEEIAQSKAGIIKDGCRVVSAPQLPGVAEVIRQTCEERNATLTVVAPQTIRVEQNSMEGQTFSYGQYTDLNIALLGSYQTRNAAVVLEITEQLRQCGWNITDEAVRKGLSAARWPARFEIVQRKPWMVVDGGHNLQCVESLTENLDFYFPGKKVTFVTGVMADKDYATMFTKIIPYAKRIITVMPDYHRALDAPSLAAFFRGQGVEEVTPCDSVEEGVKEALRLVGEDELVCAFGSFYMSGTIRSMFVAD